MKVFACGDVVPGCDTTFSAATVDEILGQVAAHAQRDHGMTEVGDDVVVAVRSAVRTV